MTNRKVISCYAPYNDGGLGRYLALLVEEAQREGSLSQYFAKVSPKEDPTRADPRGVAIDPALLPWLFKIPPIRFRLRSKDYWGGELFDRSVAKALCAADIIHGFNGKVLRTFRQAARLGYQTFLLESANSHVSNVALRHRAACQQFPLEDAWLDQRQHDKAVKEYELADQIFVASCYSRDSFLAKGIPRKRLRYRALTVNPRFLNPPSVRESDRFEIVYVGRVDVSKGVPVLIEAFRRYKNPDARLTLIGGTSTRGMRRYMERALANDNRLRHTVGDPLPYLQRASVFTHPSFEDGFGLAPMEALYLGVPAIVTADTGMKDYIEEGRNGFIIAAGTIDHLIDLWQGLANKPLKGTFAKPHYADDFPDGQ